MNKVRWTHAEYLALAQYVTERLPRSTFSYLDLLHLAREGQVAVLPTHRQRKLTSANGVTLQFQELVRQMVDAKLVNKARGGQEKPEEVKPKTAQVPALAMAPVAAKSTTPAVVPPIIVNPPAVTALQRVEAMSHALATAIADLAMETTVRRVEETLAKFHAETRIAIDQLRGEQTDSSRLKEELEKVKTEVSEVKEYFDIIGKELAELKGHRQPETRPIFTPSPPPPSPVERPRKLKLVVIGLRDRDHAHFNRHLEEAGLDFNVTYVNQDRPPFDFTADFAVVTHWTSHSWWDKAVECVGRVRTVRTNGGMPTLVSALAAAVERVTRDLQPT